MKRRRKLRGGEVHASYAEFDAMTCGIPLGELMRRLRVSRGTACRWRSGERPIPWWVPKLLFFEDYYQRDLQYQVDAKLAVRGLSYRPGSQLRDLVAAGLDAAIDRGHALLAARPAIDVRGQRRAWERERVALALLGPDDLAERFRIPGTVAVAVGSSPKRSGRRGSDGRT